MSEAYLWYGIKLPEQGYTLPYWETDWDEWWREHGDGEEPPFYEIELECGVVGLAVYGSYAYVRNAGGEPIDLVALNEGIREKQRAFMAFLAKHIYPTLPDDSDLRVGWWMGTGNT